MIPPNFDDGAFKLGGLVTWRRLIEAGASGFLSVLLGNLLIPSLLGGAFKGLIIFVITALVVLLTLVGIAGESPLCCLAGWQRFLKNRRRLSFRKPMRRVPLKASGEKWRPFKRVVCTQQLVPVEKIYQGMAAMKDGSFVKILEFDAVDFIAMEAAERRGVLAEFDA
ncbi:MAG: hypothetical protein Q4C55_09050, partial [Eubacterium sp.]|nr:hypothetical protein [Eubacterium sp.]